MKIWSGRFSKDVDGDVNDFNQSIHFDGRMYKEDIEGSIAHATMLAHQGIISADDGQAIVAELKKIMADIESGAEELSPDVEDIHMNIETILTRRLGDIGKRLHTARSRNDQVAVDIRLYIKKDICRVADAVKSLIEVIMDKAEATSDYVMPAYTHLQRAQPVTFGFYVMAYAQMFSRDLTRLADCYKRMDYSPLGSGALATTTYPINRNMTAEALGFSGICENCIDGVSDRDFLVEYASALSLIMTHLSRFSEEIILWCSSEFSFISLDDAYATGSSIMPQKKNPDVAELCRGKTGRVYGHLMSLLTMLKGLPLAYNKDMQEDKEAIFDAADTVKGCLKVFTPMIATMTVKKENLRRAAAKGYINATDCADYLTKKGMPFRDAYKLVGKLVAYCESTGKELESLSMAEYKELCPTFEEDVYDAINLDNCVKGRAADGGPAPEALAKQIEKMKAFVKAYKI